MINVTKISTKQFTGNLGEKSDTSKKKESTTFSPNIKNWSCGNNFDQFL